MITTPWWDKDAYVCDRACIDDFCRNARECAWPNAMPPDADDYVEVGDDE